MLTKAENWEDQSLIIPSLPIQASRFCDSEQKAFLSIHCVE